jgi:flagellar biosynthetic protein FliR
MSNVQVSLIGQFKFFIGTLVFLAMNGHHEVLKALHRSFDFIPPGQIVAKAAVGGFIVDAGTTLFAVAVRIASPIVISLLVVSFFFGIISRTVPEINFMINGFELRIAAGLIILGLGIAFYVEIMQGFFEQMPQQIMGFMKLFAP